MGGWGCVRAFVEGRCQQKERSLSGQEQCWLKSYIQDSMLFCCLKVADQAKYSAECNGFRVDGRSCSHRLWPCLKPPLPPLPTCFHSVCRLLWKVCHIKCHLKPISRERKGEKGGLGLRLQKPPKKLGSQLIFLHRLRSPLE